MLGGPGPQCAGPAVARRRRAMTALTYTQLGLVAVWLMSGLTKARAADPTRGQALYESRCIACHSLDIHRVGPAHRGIVGRRAGSAPGYEYSRALAESDLIWTAQNLDRWLMNPERLIPGQKMGFRVDEASDRADLIAYLATAIGNLSP